MSVAKKILELLDENNIVYSLLKHEPVHSSEEAAFIRNTPLSSGIKAMIVQAEQEIWLLLFPANKKASWKKVKQVLQCKNVSLVSPEEAEKISGVEMGSVPPFPNILGFKSIFDPDIRQNTQVNFNIGERTLSVSMRLVDLESIITPDIIEEISQEK